MAPKCVGLNSKKNLCTHKRQLEITHVVNIALFKTNMS